MFEDEDSDIVKVLAGCLESLLKIESPTETPTKFHSISPPTISLGRYLERIHSYANCSDACFVVSLVYIDRLCQRSVVPLSILTVHRVLITAVCLAAKVHEDFFFPNVFYAQLGGIPLHELNTLEVEFLFGIDFTLHVSTEVYEKYANALFPTKSRAHAFDSYFSHDDVLLNPISASSPKYPPQYIIRQR